MKAFRYVRVTGGAGAAGDLVRKGAVLKAGGSDLLDRMKERLLEPDDVVALDEIDSDYLRSIADDGDALRIGALVTLAEIAESPKVGKRCAALADAARQAASPQVRHRATLGGNLCQHTRCDYYRQRSFPCWKRGADACPVLVEGAVQESAGIFGNAQCASAHPASLPPVLGALGATVVVRGAKEREERAFADLWRAPAQGVAEDVALAPGDVVVSVVIPPAPPRTEVAYEEVRQKAAFDWALVSCGARITRDAGKVVEASIWLGSVAPTPYRAVLAEQALVGRAPDAEAIAAAAEAAVAGATPLPGNTYKLQLVRVVVRRALERAARRER